MSRLEKTNDSSTAAVALAIKLIICIIVGFFATRILISEISFMNFIQEDSNFNAGNEYVRRFIDSHPYTTGNLEYSTYYEYTEQYESNIEYEVDGVGYNKTFYTENSLYDYDTEDIKVWYLESDPSIAYIEQEISTGSNAPVVIDKSSMITIIISSAVLLIVLIGAIKAFITFTRSGQSDMARVRMALERYNRSNPQSYYSPKEQYEHTHPQKSVPDYMKQDYGNSKYHSNEAYEHTHPQESVPASMRDSSYRAYNGYEDYFESQKSKYYNPDEKPDWEK